MPGRKQLRRVVAPPAYKSYRPHEHRYGRKESVELLYEEYEALKLADYRLFNQEEAAKLMAVSRATFARIYESTRRKIARALVETRELVSVFGNASLDQSWFECQDCKARFNIPGPQQEHCCPVCRSERILHIRTEDENTDDS